MEEHELREDQALTTPPPEEHPGEEEAASKPKRRKSKDRLEGKKRSSSKGSLSGLTLDTAEGEELSEEARRERRERKERKERKRAERRSSSKASLSVPSSPSQDLAAAPAGAEDEDDIEAMMAEEELQVNKLNELQVVTEDPEEAKDGKKGKKGKKGDKKGDKKDAGEKSVSYFALFRFADWIDIIMVVVGSLSAVCHGILMPMFAIFFGDIIDAFQVTADPSASPGDFGAILESTVNDIAAKFVILAAVAAVSSFFQVFLLMFAGQRQANRIRQIYFRALLSQEVGWYDVHETGELTTRISGDILLIQEAISEKLGTFLQMFTMFIAGFVVGFIEGWQLSLVILSVVPLLAICGAIMGKLITEFTNSTQKSYGKAGGVAEEVISSMRTVAAFGGEQLERNRYAAALQTALKAGVKKSHSAGAGIGVTMFIMFCSYSLAFWYGNELIGAGKMSAGKILSVFFGILIGAMSIGQASPSIAAFGSGAGAATKIFEVIERRSKIDSLSDEGLKPETARGEIEFRNVKFTYPSRPDQPILHGISFKLLPGQTLAFVGPSGCGKSTSIALLERFYDPTEGEILFDGCEVRQLSIKWLRSQIGLVSQEPVLFNKTIAENITFGMTNVPQEEIERACRMANAHDFIKALPQGYQTMVGERGTQLSGGQKQRIAIARALIRDPKVLLLDEATSALDNNSEKVVQDALDKASKGRSTIVIAHRLSTIRNADIICVVEKGRIIEQGTHDELMAKPGKSLYQELVKLQEIAGKEEQGAAKEPKALLTPQAAAVEKLPSKKVSAAVAAEAEEEKEITDEEKQALAKGVVWRSFRLNMPELPFIIFGSIGAIANGAVFPVFSLVFGEVLFDLLNPDEEYRNKKIAQWCLVFVGLAAGTGIANYLQTGLFGVSGERLTDRLRNMLFAAIVRQDIGWFDEDKNATGVLSTKLATDASQVKGMTGERVGITLQLLSTFVSGLIIALISCWQLALVVLSCVPLVGVAGAMQLKLLTGFNQKAKKAYEGSGKIASEALMNIRTVYGLGVQQEFRDSYKLSLAAPNKGARKSAVVAGAGFSVGEAMQFLIWALAFWYGAQLAGDGKCQFDEMMKAISAILFGAVMMGQLTSLMPDFGKAKAAGASIYAIIDRTPAVDSFSQEGTKLPQVSGTIEFRNVHFHYPTRPSAKILKGLSFTLKPGQTLALVGPSGCGKSTSISLLERFYNPSDGQIFLDGVEVRSLNVSWLRRQIGLVGQEPVLFGTSIKENIAYGKEGQATDQEIQRAAMMANAHKFIQALGSKYDTDVGEKGSQLSGGQKQRVAIARALIRDPKILLLDEATSALDSESEKIVQNALNKARKGRTTIVIAHRLSTIQNADQIAVVDKGIVVEQGTHFELLQKKGLYYRLVNQRVDPL